MFLGAIGASAVSPDFFFLKQISFECWRLLGLLGVTESLVFTMECGALYAATVLSITDSEGTRELRWSTLYRLFSTQSLSAPSWILTRVLRFPTPEGWEHRKWKSNCNRARLRRFSLQDAVFFFFTLPLAELLFFLLCLEDAFGVEGREMLWTWGQGCGMPWRSNFPEDDCKNIGLHKWSAIEYLFSHKYKDVIFAFAESAPLFSEAHVGWSVVQWCGQQCFFFLITRIGY